MIGGNNVLVDVDSAIVLIENGKVMSSVEVRKKAETGVDKAGLRGCVLMSIRSCVLKKDTRQIQDIYFLCVQPESEEAEERWMS